MVSLRGFRRRASCRIAGVRLLLVWLLVWLLVGLLVGLLVWWWWECARLRAFLALQRPRPWLPLVDSLLTALATVSCLASVHCLPWTMSTLLLGFVSMATLGCHRGRRLRTLPRILKISRKRLTVILRRGTVFARRVHNSRLILLAGKAVCFNVTEVGLDRDCLDH